MNSKIAFQRRLLLATSAAMGVMSAFANSCIISGSTDRPCTASAFVVAPEIEVRASMAGWGAAEDMPELESRIWWVGFGDPLLMFSSDMPGFLLFVR